MENVNVMTAVSAAAVENTKPKHKWLAKGQPLRKESNSHSNGNVLYGSNVYHAGFCRYR